MEFHFESLYQRNSSDNGDELKQNQNKQEVDNKNQEDFEKNDLSVEFDKLTTSIWGSLSSIVGNVSSKVKEKSETLINIYKEDIQEFKSNLQNTTNSDDSNLLTSDPLMDVIESPSNSNGNNSNDKPQQENSLNLNTITNSLFNNNLTSPILNKISSGISNLLSEYPNPDDINITNNSVHNKTTITSTTLQQSISNNNNNNNNIDLQEKDYKLYLNDPENTLEYQNFLNNHFKIQDYQKNIVEILTSGRNNLVKDSYNKLVPLKVNESNFWSRYFYKEFQIQENKRKLEGLISKQDEEEEEILWDNNNNNNNDDEKKTEDLTTSEINNNDIDKEKLKVIESYEIPSTKEILPKQQTPIINNNVNIRTPTFRNMNNKTPSSGELNEWEVIDKRSATSTEEEDWSSWE